jgi:hypothetical protein
MSALKYMIGKLTVLADSEQMAQIPQEATNHIHAALEILRASDAATTAIHAYRQIANDAKLGHVPSIRDMQELVHGLEFAEQFANERNVDPNDLFWNDGIDRFPISNYRFAQVAGSDRWAIVPVD